MFTFPPVCSVSLPKRLGQPGTPGGQDLEAALRSLSARQQNHSSDRPFFDVERERKLRALAANCKEGDGSSGFQTPNDSLASSSDSSTGTNYSNGSSRHSCGSSGGSRSYLPDRLQIVKPLEGNIAIDPIKAPVTCSGSLFFSLHVGCACRQAR